MSTKPTPPKEKGTRAEVYERLEKAKRFANLNYNSLYTSVSDVKKRQDLCAAHALLVEIFGLRRDSVKDFALTDIIDVFMSFGLSRPKISVKYPLQSFSNTLHKIGAEEKIFSYLLPKQRGLTKKTDIIHEHLAIKYFDDDKKPNCKQVTEIINNKVKSDGLTEVTEAWVKWIIAKYKDKGFEFIKRYGRAHYRYNNETPIHRINALNPLDRVEFDATVFSIQYFDPKERRNRTLNTCIAVDCNTGMIVGKAHAKTENGDLYVETIKNSFKGTLALPAEMFFDQFPGHNSEKIKALFEILKSLGVIVNIDRTGNARQKAKVEKTVDLLCTILFTYDGFIGKNITTKSLESRVSSERFKKIATVTRTRDEVEKTIDLAIAEFNLSLSKKDKQSKKELFQTRPKPNAIIISEIEDYRLFYNWSQLTVDKGLITLQKNWAKYYFELPEDKKSLYHRRMVKVRFDDSKLGLSDSVIHVFDIDTDDFLFTCQLQVMPHLAAINQTEKDKTIYQEHIKRNKKIRSAHVDARAQIDERLSRVFDDIELANHMTATKEQVQEAEIQYLEKVMGFEPKLPGEKKYRPVIDRLDLGMEEGHLTVAEVPKDVSTRLGDFDIDLERVE